MCTVSAVGDNYQKLWPERWPGLDPLVPIQPAVDPDALRGWKRLNNQTAEVQYVTLEQFEELKRELEALRELLKAAAIFDKATNQPHCETDEKVALLKKLGETMGVNMDEVFK